MSNILQYSKPDDHLKIREQLSIKEVSIEERNLVRSSTSTSPQKFCIILIKHEEWASEKFKYKLVESFGGAKIKDYTDLLIFPHNQMDSNNTIITTKVNKGDIDKYVFIVIADDVTAHFELKKLLEDQKYGKSVFLSRSSDPTKIKDDQRKAGNGEIDPNRQEWPSSINSTDTLAIPELSQIMRKLIDMENKFEQSSPPDLSFILDKLVNIEKKLAQIEKQYSSILERLSSTETPEQNYRGTGSDTVYKIDSQYSPEVGRSEIVNIMSKEAKCFEAHYHNLAGSLFQPMSDSKYTEAILSIDEKVQNIFSKLGLKGHEICEKFQVDLYNNVLKWIKFNIKSIEGIPEELSTKIKEKMRRHKLSEQYFSIIPYWEIIKEGEEELDKKLLIIIKRYHEKVFKSEEECLSALDVFNEKILLPFVEQKIPNNTPDMNSNERDKLSNQLLEIMGVEPIIVEIGTPFEENIYDFVGHELREGFSKNVVLYESTKGYKSKFTGNTLRKPGVITTP